MKFNINYNKNEPVTPDLMLKTTSLIYLKDALANERYEDCAEFIKTAKRFGAEKSEVKKVISGYIRGLRVGRRNGAYKGSKGRRRF